jgi:hypothetical protein
MSEQKVQVSDTTGDAILFEADTQKAPYENTGH